MPATVARNTLHSDLMTGYPLGMAGTTSATTGTITIPSRVTEVDTCHVMSNPSIIVSFLTFSNHFSTRRHRLGP